MQGDRQKVRGETDGEDDHFREIVVKGTVKREEDENSLVDSIAVSYTHLTLPTSCCV